MFTYNKFVRPFGIIDMLANFFARCYYSLCTEKASNKSI